MATVFNEQIHQESPVPRRELRVTEAHFLERLFRPLASLKLTVALFLAAIFVILIGTLAQVKDDIWQVVRDYFRLNFRELTTPDFPWLNFRELVFWVDPKLFFPPAFAPEGPPNFPEWLGIWFPKGWIIGLLMLINLITAHLFSFKIQAHGKRLWVGTGVIGLGAVVTLLVILSGSSADGLQATPVLSYTTMWWLLQSTTFGLCVLCIYLTATVAGDRKEQRWLFGGLAAVLAIASMLAFNTEASNESTMRILYQVIKATFAGLVLLAGCIAVFKKRAGIVLLHAGIGLMMSYDVLVGLQHVESQMSINEGDTVNFSRDMRDAELAVSFPAGAREQNVTVLDARMLSREGTVLKDPRLPFQIEVVKYYPNSNVLDSSDPGHPVPPPLLSQNPATTGIGKRFLIDSVDTSTGTDVKSTFDAPSAYLKLTDPSGNDLGTYMVSSQLDVIPFKIADTVTVAGKTYDIALRFRRLYHPFQITLTDFQKNDYKGTRSVRDFSSYITLNDPSRNTKFDTRIWMNNPMRYAGKTFYQSSFGPDQKSTVLQVVDNAGWMTPYVACMMVVVGMVYHFGQTVVRYLHRRAREKAGINQSAPFDKVSWGVTAVIVGSVTAAFLYMAARPGPSAKEMNLRAFGELPLWYKGRPQPLDTFARNSLMQLSDYQSFKLKPDDKKSQPAILWLIDLMSDEKKARDYPIIRIENEDVRNAIGLENRKGFAYSINELQERVQKIIEEAMAAQKVPAKERTIVQRKTVELANRVIFYSFLERTLGRAPKMPDAEKTEGTDPNQQLAARAQNYLEYIQVGRETMTEFAEQYGLGPLPLVVPTHLGVDRERIKLRLLDSAWEPLMIAHIYHQFYGEFPAPTPPAVEDFIQILDDYKAGDVSKFNADVAKYQALLVKHASPDDLPVAKVQFEAWYNRFGAFNVCSWLYVFAFVLAVSGWLAYSSVFERASFWLIMLILAVHTGALIGRIYISGRPPVTNLYSSAVFIGWAAVIGSLIIERLTKLGIGNAVAGAAGFVTLRIANGLAGDGDTFVVLEAVLDTQFWLATHVVCITLGYATTYLAGLFGLAYILTGVFTPNLTPRIARELARMIYGVTCFAIFFSFWGTVLGGLWADDSWGRFWGWDPKENGALIIVLWNALLLHARWGKMVQDRGLAILAILGNIVTSWSWFGVNELGVGLHSYGFTEGRLRMLMLFVLSQLLVVAIGLIPKQYWPSFRRQAALPEETSLN